MVSLKLFIRHLLKNKLYTTVTIVGFAISLTFILLLSVYIENELSVDNFNPLKERVYRIESEGTDFSGPIAEDLKNSIPEIEAYTRIYESGGIISAVSDQKLNINFLAVDPTFFDMFSYPLYKGNSSEVLQQKNSIVLSKSFANKVFRAISPIGKTVNINNDLAFVVTGIMEDFPEKTHLKSQDAIINIKAMADITGWNEFLTEYGFCSMSIYFLESENSNLPSKTPEILENFKKDFWLYKDGYAKTLEFTPLKEVYFSSKNGDGTKSNSKTLILILSVIVLLILFLAIGNYVNLTIAQSTFRGREVAIKKLLGGSKRKLFFQFISESILLCFVALVLSLFLTKLAEPVFNSLLDTQLHLNEKITFLNLLFLVGVFVLIGLISGILPALKITNFKPIEVVKGSLQRKSKGVYGKVFITFQYTVTIALLACSWFILKQTHFMQNYNVGFNKDNIIQMEYLGGADKKSEIKEALLKIPGVDEVSLSWGSPLDGGSNQSFEYKGKPMSFQEFRVDSSFFKVFNIAMKPTDIAYTKEGIYLNETALKVLEFNTIPAAFQMREDEPQLPILGVVNDFNFNDLSKHIGPIIIHQQDDTSYASIVSIKINGTNMLETINKIKATYAPLISNFPFNITFVDDTLNQWYIKEERTGKIIGYFTILSFIISFLGILAMSTFYIQQRKKEIGIRKVNGATVGQVLSLLNKDFLKWVGVAFFIAVPITWYAMSMWLESFAYKTTLSWWIFALAGSTAFFIAFITVSWQSFRAAINNPVDALRNE